MTKQTVHWTNFEGKYAAIVGISSFIQIQIEQAEHVRICNWNFLEEIFSIVQ